MHNKNISVESTKNIIVEVLANYEIYIPEEGGHALSATNFIYVNCVIYIPKCSKMDEHADYLVRDSSEDT